MRRERSFLMSLNAAELSGCVMIAKTVEGGTPKATSASMRQR